MSKKNDGFAKMIEHCVTGKLLQPPKKEDRPYISLTKKEYEELLKDKNRLNFIEHHCCTAHEGIKEIKMNLHILVGETKLRPAIDKSINFYKKEGWLNDQNSN